MSGITAILPAFNEEVSIGSVVLRTRKYADRVIVVDDGSSDSTADVAAMAGGARSAAPEEGARRCELRIFRQRIYENALWFKFSKI
ncbi:MAG: glycosyltransferase [Methanothrix sp.]|nr:glycosyltransferase [Methanothrix sp.]